MEGIGERILLIRKDLRLNQTTFGKTIGISKDAVVKMENNVSLPKIKTLTEIVNIYHINYEWLITGFGEKTKEKVKVVEEERPYYGKINDLKAKLDFDDEQLELLNEYIELKIKEVLNKVELKVK